MYPGYSGTPERPVKEGPDGVSRGYPSPLAFWPTFAWDPADLADELREHDAIFAEEAPAILSAARRDVAKLGVEFTHGALMGCVTTVRVDGAVRSLSSDGRLGAIHSDLPRDFRRQLVLASSPSESHVVVVTPAAISLRTAVVHIEDGAPESARAWLTPGRLLSVQPSSARVRRVGPMDLWWGRTSRRWLRVAVTRRPVVPADPDTEMDALLRGYRAELLARLATETDPADALGWLVSKRTVGDTVTVFPREAPIDWLAEQVGLAEPAPRPAPAGWLPVVVQTGSHIALRWLAIPTQEAGEDAPAVTKAVAVGAKGTEAKAVRSFSGASK